MTAIKTEPKAWAVTDTLHECKWLKMLRTYVTQAFPNYDIKFCDSI